MNIETAIKFSGETLDGHMINGNMVFQRLLDFQVESQVTKEELKQFIEELQKVYSKMNQELKIQIRNAESKKNFTELGSQTSLSPATPSPHF